jgi:hypothetical protein
MNISFRMFASAFLFLITSASLAYAQTAPTLERVPESQLSGQTLHINARASVQAPAGWLWYRLPSADRAAHALHPQLGSETYLAQDPITHGSYLISAIHDASSSAINDEYMKGVGSGLERTSPKTGWHITEYTFEASSTPVSATYRYSCVATSDAGVVKHRFGYMLGGDVKYHLSYSTVESTESERFREFVASFRLQTSNAAD